MEREVPGQGLAALQQLAQTAQEGVELWRRSVLASQDSGGYGEQDFFLDDMLADAEDWAQACGWVWRQAREELAARRWGRFCALGRTLVEEAAGGAAEEDMLVLIWAMGGEPPVEVEEVEAVEEELRHRKPPRRLLPAARAAED